MGILKCGNLNFNDSRIVVDLQNRIQLALENPNNYYVLSHINNYYFSAPAGPLPNEPGWYIILEGSIPIYVGKADSLNKRLNSKDGSRDQFADPQRKSENSRNFIKKYTELEIINNLRVCLITEAVLFGNMQLSDIDLANTEKFLNIWRGKFRYVEH